jgi:hypothetical protein
MIRSVALTFSIVANRAWSMLCIAVFAPEASCDGSAISGSVSRAVGARQ